ncbi:uncharacterized protein I206_106942 [Kwoniella pini CBS 10737]|uniref:DUF1746 domain-containing protein n=1 Tax=Kwoniella pini CBS 10737 TaxID=1296096 RepID=A0A1B9HZP4_9TREE|nr:uncharacterized protein I206_05515 [Kwoniella pini CBS 10737]OCF48734.1 hypothetical protein I206_05515 [Kwoniella pini CBS 10737]
MVYAPQRRHAVASLATTAQALCVMQHFYTPNLLILISRVLAQVQINACAFIHPSKSLFGLSLMLVALNIAAAFLHLLDFAGGMNGGKGLVLDFVGQANPASLTRILLLDLLLFLMQLTGLCVSYVNHSTHLPKSPAFPYDDLLLPPAEEGVAISTSIFDEDEEDLDLEQGKSTSKSRRRKGGQRYEAVQGDEEESELWLNDDMDHTQPSANLIRIHEPPLIFTLPLRHILRLMWNLPSPSPPPRAFSGGTPISTPPLTPAASSLPRISDPDPPQDDRTESRQSGLGLIGTQAGGSESEGPGRIPGDYRRSDW